MTRETVKTVLLCIVAIPCACLNAPCLICIYYKLRKSSPCRLRHLTHEHRDRHFAGYPTPVKLRSSDSALTLPLSPTPELQKPRHTTSSQSHCLLLMKLPLELRKLIWERCIGGRTLHFTMAHYRGQKQSKLVHIVCQEKPNHKGCFSKWLPLKKEFDDNGNMIATRPWQNSRFLSLVLTCRQIYSEAIDCLYASNTFDLSVSCIRVLPGLLLPQRFDAIRSLHLKWENIGRRPIPPNCNYYCEPSWNKWVDTWKILAGIKSLSALDVELSVFFSDEEWIRYRMEEKFIILQPVRDVTRPAKFCVLLPYLLPLDDPPIMELPCSISFATPIH